MAKQIIWTTKMVNEAAEKISNGFVLGRTENPFFDNTVGLRKGKLTISEVRENSNSVLIVEANLEFSLTSLIV